MLHSCRLDRSETAYRYGAFGLAEFGLMALGALDIPADVGRAAVAWYVFLWEPTWLLGGLLFLATARAAPRA